MPNEKKDLVFRVDGETGEILSQFEIGDGESLTSSEKLHKRKIFMEKKNDFENLKEVSDELGGFCFLYYKKSEILYKEEGISKSNISRLIYLATFIDYETNEIVDYKSNGKKYSLGLKDIKALLKLSEKTFNEFFKEMIEREIIHKQNENFFISKKYFSKGKLSKNENSFTRMFIQTIRDLYEATSSRQHKQLANVFSLVPFLDYETNAIVGTDGEKLRITEIARLLGYDESHTDRMKKDLLGFSIVKDNTKFYFFNYVTVKDYENETSFFMVNPLAFYAGSSENTFRALAKLMKK